MKTISCKWQRFQTAHRVDAFDTAIAFIYVNIGYGSVSVYLTILQPEFRLFFSLKTVRKVTKVLLMESNPFKLDKYGC